MDEATVRQEVMLAFSRVLGCELGEFDNFFDLGGDSQKAVELIETVSERFGIYLEFALLLDCPSPAELSGRVLGKLGRAR
ncbi:acyl carrier protein [Paracoccus sp. MBLB3053]|uniref:Acyl carrier protein n=1 Tax=Paracoccus aurantius TaxID=3073814 RepID=A0ABU2HW32_9RHOB|nr:acyl carrier protein [Paracoccus sp. MBLB3053]MDS9469258.1 acyl carrier protein [Paracoccus sp. MBLB3053]